MKGPIQGIARICTRTAIAVAAAAIMSTGSWAQDSTGVVVDAAGNRTHTVRAGETLWDIAHTYLGDGDLWPEIIRLNRHLVQDPHWIFPNEVLRIPAAPAGASSAMPALAAATPSTTTDASAPSAANPATATPAATPSSDVTTSASPPAAADQTPTTDAAADTGGATPADDASAAPGATLFTRPPQGTPLFGTGRARVGARRKHQGVSPGDHNGAPYLDRDGGPLHTGAIVGVVDVSSVINAAEVAHYSLYQNLYITMPAGAHPEVGQRFYSYTLGQSFGDLGQVIEPTGIVTVVRPGQGHEATVAQITQQFGYMELGQGVLPVDQGNLPMAPAEAMSGGSPFHVVWVEHDQVLPTVGFYVVFGATAKSNVHMGDQLTLFRPRATVPGTTVELPESEIAVVQVVRVTPFGVTGIVTNQYQPDIEPGVNARVTARIP